MAPSETMTDSNVIPIGDKPKNKPVSPIVPKLRATDRTASSAKSSLFSFTNKRFTKQYPGTIATNAKPKDNLTTHKGELLGIVKAKRMAIAVTRRIISNQRIGLTEALQDLPTETKNKRVEI
jgi:hypothetical protein